METAARRIEIFAPFGAAIDLTKRILFQPFDLAKWCVIGFAAFLATLGGGGGGGNGFNFNRGSGDWNFRDTAHEALNRVEAMPGWAIALVCAAVLFVIALIVALTWLRSRGIFIFTDCVVRNRGAIVEPWKQFRREGNSLFLLRVAVGFIWLLLLALGSMPLWLPLVRYGTAPEGCRLVGGIALLAMVFVIALVTWAMISIFLIPIMYRQRCGAMQALHEALGLINAEPGPVILFFLFTIVLGVAMLIGVCEIVCLTCCLAAIPYVGTVILLPVHVFWMSFTLLFVRQFGPEYDVWVGSEPGQLDAPPVQSASSVPPQPPPLPSES